MKTVLALVIFFLLKTWDILFDAGTVEPSKRTPGQQNMGHGIKPTKQEQGEPSEVHVKN